MQDHNSNLNGPAPARPPVAPARLAEIKAKARLIRRNVLLMARGKGEGYVGQGLGAADMLAALYFHEMRYDARNPDWPERDRFLLSTGHYSIALYAALTAIGLYPESELASYGADESHFGMSTVCESPGVEITGGSLGMGLAQAVGLALGARLKGGGWRVFGAAQRQSNRRAAGADDRLRGDAPGDRRRGAGAGDSKPRRD